MTAKIPNSKVKYSYGKRPDGFPPMTNEESWDALFGFKAVRGLWAHLTEVEGADSSRVVALEEFIKDTAARLSSFFLKSEAEGMSLFCAASVADYLRATYQEFLSGSLSESDYRAKILEGVPQTWNSIFGNGFLCPWTESQLSTAILSKEDIRYQNPAGGVQGAENRGPERAACEVVGKLLDFGYRKVHDARMYFCNVEPQVAVARKASWWLPPDRKLQGTEKYLEWSAGGKRALKLRDRGDPRFRYLAAGFKYNFRGMYSDLTNLFLLPDEVAKAAVASIRDLILEHEKKRILEESTLDSTRSTP